MHRPRPIGFLRWLVPAVVASSCFFRAGARLSPLAQGCYDVRAEGWSADAAKIVGFRALPESLWLDTTRLGRVVVPNAWRFADPPNENSADLGLYLGPWRREGDSLVFEPAARAHAAGADSIILTWYGWGGRMTAYLGLTEAGYRGLAMVEPRQLARGLPGITVELTRRSCRFELP